jgi:hypothetical protein
VKQTGKEEKEGKKWDIDSRHDSYEAADIRRHGLLLQHGPTAPIKVKKMKNGFLVKTRLVLENKNTRGKRRSKRKKRRNGVAS